MVSNVKDIGTTFATEYYREEIPSVHMMICPPNLETRLEQVRFTWLGRAGGRRASR